MLRQIYYIIYIQLLILPVFKEIVANFIFIIREYENTIEEQRQSLQQMKVYMSETEAATKSSEIWRKELNELKNQLQVS